MTITPYENVLPIDTTFVVTFSEPVVLGPDPVRFSKDNLLDTYATDVRLSADGQTMTIKPLGLTAPLDVVLSFNNSDIRDLAGNMLLGTDQRGFRYPAWIVLGTNLGYTPTLGVSGYSLSIDNGGDVYIAFSQYSYTGGTSDTDLWVKRWTASAGWTALGGTLKSAAGTGLSRPSIAARGSVVAVAFEEGPVLTRSVYVKEWDGSSWNLLGGSIDQLGSATTPALALDASGTPVIAWERTTANQRAVMVAKWSGSGWATLGTVLNTSAQNASAPQIVLDPAGNPVVAFLEDLPAGGAGVFVKAWNGTEWVLLGGPLNTSIYAQNVSLVLDASNRPVVAWDEGEVYAAVYDGSSFGVPARVTTSKTGTGTPSLALDDVFGVVATWTWQDEFLNMSRWDTTAWSDVGPVNSLSGVWIPWHLLRGAPGVPLTLLFLNRMPGAEKHDLQVWRYNR
jgi:hypothetical protein